ncbi:MAG: Ldh family oxidoreductase, partial [Bacteroidota bacterium]|nr:Ldh family oxidoreductase [Bacteroidota bacterium]
MKGCSNYSGLSSIILLSSAVRAVRCKYGTRLCSKPSPGFPLPSRSPSSIVLWGATKAAAHLAFIHITYICAMSKIYSYQALYSFARQIFLKIGCNEKDAEVAAGVLLSADLRGVDSHGVARLSGYVRLWEAKRMNATP